MNRTITAFVVMVAFLAVASATSGDISIANLNIAPNPAIAGSNFTATFQLYNNYNYALNNVNLNLVGSYPLLNFSPAQTYLISSMGEGLYNGVNSYFSYTFNVPTDTTTGLYTVYLDGTYQTTSSTIEGTSTYTQSVTGSSSLPITVYIHGMPNVTVGVGSIAPVTPGSGFSAVLDVINTGGGVAKNLTLYASSTSSLKVIGSETAKLGNLNGGATASVTLSILANQNLTNSTYTIPVNLRYLSDTGKAYSSNLMVPISVAVDNPDISVSLAGAMPSVLYRGYNQSVGLQVQNTGLGLARNISIAISGGPGIEVESSVNYFFIGALQPGQTTTESIFITATQNAGQNATIDSALSYYSANYQHRFARNNTLYVAVAPAAQFKILSQKTSAVPGSTDVPVTYTIENVGNIGAEGIQLSLQTVYPVNPIDSSAYVSELQPGQSTNVTFLINVDSNGASGSYPVTVYEQWKQPNGVANQLYSGSSSNYVGIDSQSSAYGNYGGIAAAAVVIIVAAFIAYRVMSRKKTVKKK